MTAMMRQKCQQTLTFWLLLGVVFAAASPIDAAGREPPAYVVEALSGVALGGNDPVSYFVEPTPVAGKPDYEYDWGGVPWYFATAANRDVFARSPQVYAPQYTGHATTALAEGYLSDGNPSIYLVVADRLYLFYSPETREAFLKSPKALLAAADKFWSRYSADTDASPQS
jgi:YHS domain-containing protein